MIGRAEIIRGDARQLPLADASVDLLVTSPPYWALRSYQDAGAHYTGQIGSEPTPSQFVAALIDCTREWVRVLKPSGSMWINLGDKYANRPAGGNFGQKGNPAISSSGRGSRVGSRPMGSDGNSVQGIRDKSLIGIPWRYALRCIDELGLILRAEIIWAKPNGLPESVTDRVRRSHEQWFHFTREPRYFSAVDEIREEHTTPRTQPRDGGEPSPWGRSGKFGDVTGERHNTGNALGKLPGSVWTIPTQPLTVPPELGVDHFAAFPMEWPRRIIQGWSPAGVCTVCGEGRRPVIARPGGSWHDHDSDGQGHNQNGSDRKRRYNERIAAGLVASHGGYECACGTEEATPPGSAVPAELFRKSVASTNRLPPTRPATILDPFGGTGTTALVAKALGRNGISVDMSADYCRLAEWRCNDPGQMAAALQVEKPEPVSPDQLDLFDLQPADA